MPGYSTSMIITEAGLYLRVTLVNKFVNGGNCLDRINEIRKSYSNGEFMRRMNESFKGTSIMAVYGTHKVYRVDDISIDRTIENTVIEVKGKDGVIETKTMEQYYKSQYPGLQIKDLNQPLFIHYQKDSQNADKAIYLIPELFQLTGMDEKLRSDEALKKTLTSRTKVDPKGIY